MTTPPSTHARTGSAPKHEKPLTTDEEVRALARPRKGRRDYHVKDTPGLMVRVSSTSVAFVVRKRGPRVDDRPGPIHKIVLGHFPEMSLEAAKTIAAEKVKLIRRGLDPKQENTANHSLGKAYESAISNRPLKPATHRDYQNRFDRHLKQHAGTPMSVICGADGSAWVRARMQDAQANATKGEGVTEANRLRALLSMICTEWCSSNPSGRHPILEKRVRKAVGANGLPPAKRDNKLTLAQVDKYVRALDRYAAGEGRAGKLPDTRFQHGLRRDVADFLLLNLYVGLRKSNGLGLQWDWIDWDARKIKVPASETKTKRPYSIRFPAPVLAMLQRRREESEGTLVFPGRRDPSKPMNSPGRAHKAVLALAGLPEDAVTIHDMRRTLGSAMIAKGLDITDVRDQLGHENVATTSIYLNLDDEPSQADGLERVAAAFGGGEAVA